MSYESIYKQAIKNGCSERLADMLASRKAPDSVTEAEYFKGRHNLADQFRDNEGQLTKIVAAARKHGFNPTRSMVYEPALARFVGDPQAFVPSSGGKEHIAAVCKKNNWKCNGAVKVENHASDPEKGAVDMDARLVEQYAKKMATENPALRRKTKAELRQMAKQKHQFK